MKKNLEILLTTSLDYENAQIVIHLCEKAITLGKNIKIFLLDEGVYNLTNEEFFALVNRGVKIFCENSNDDFALGLEGIIFKNNNEINNLISCNLQLITFT